MYQQLEMLFCVQEIAIEKAGIFKPGSPALTIPQEPEAQQALEVCRLPLVCNCSSCASLLPIYVVIFCADYSFSQKRAAELDIQLTVVPALHHYFKGPAVQPSIGLAGR